MPTLEWIGKEKVINHHQEVPFRVLERQYSFDENGQHTEDNGSENMIIHGDNLDALKALLPRYEGRVKCIYIDPPYNTGNEGWIYNDNVNDPKIRKWLGEVVGKEGEDLTRHDKWLCMMYPRLKLLQKLLAEDGAIFIRLVWYGSPLDVNREVNNGRGPVDYKISYGSKISTLVEFKLASNSKLKQNLAKQVDVYKAASNTERAIKVILFFSEAEEKKILDILNELNLAGNDDIVLIDARNDNKPSASNVKL